MPVVVNSFRNVQSGILKFVYRVKTSEVLNLTGFEYSTDGGLSWGSSSSLSGRLNNITGDVIDTIYWDSRVNLSGYEGFVKVRFKFSSVGNDYFVNVDNVGVDNLAPRFRGIKSGVNLPFNKVVLKWDEAEDISKPLRYKVFVSTTSVGFDFTKPYAETDKDTVFISGLETSRYYYFVVRVSDIFGQETSSVVYSLKVNALCDYNGDNRVDAFDVGRYVSFWSLGDYSGSDIYPYDGQIPYVVVRGDGKLNVDDIFTFTKMWDYSHIRGLPKVLSSFDGGVSRREIKVKVGEEFVFRPDVKGRFISYGVEVHHKGVKVRGFSSLRDGICLVYRDSLNDLIYFDYAKVGGIDEFGEGLFRMNFEGGDSVIVKFVAYDEGSIESGRSSYEVEYVLRFEHIPKEYALYQNYPNPFNPTTTIEFDIPEKTFVKIVIYDILGREIEKLVDGELDAGRYKVKFDAYNLPSGVYFCRMEAGRFVKVVKMVLMK